MIKPWLTFSIHTAGLSSGKRPVARSVRKARGRLRTAQQNVDMLRTRYNSSGATIGGSTPGSDSYVFYVRHGEGKEKQDCSEDKLKKKTLFDK